jgi:hypothetical protein
LGSCPQPPCCRGERTMRAACWDWQRFPSAGPCSHVGRQRRRIPSLSLCIECMASTHRISDAWLSKRQQQDVTLAYRATVHQVSCTKQERSNINMQSNIHNLDKLQAQMEEPLESRLFHHISLTCLVGCWSPAPCHHWIASGSCY